MDTLHTVLRSIKGDAKSRRDHVSVFRQFLDHLERIGRQRAARPRPPNGKGNGDARRRSNGKG